MSYALEKLGIAIDVMTTGEGDIKSRLRKAFRHISAVREDDFPDELKKDWKSIMNRLTKRESKFKGSEIDEGSFKTTMHGMHKKTAVQIAKNIVDLHIRLEGYIKDEYDQY